MRERGGGGGGVGLFVMGGRATGTRPRQSVAADASTPGRLS